MIKIAFIIPKPANQGPIIVVKDIIDSIKQRVDLIDVYYFDDVFEVDFDCNIYKIDFFTKIDFNKYDVVHSHMLRPDFFVWLHRKKHHKALFISTLHQNIFDNLKGNYNAYIAFIFEKIWVRFLKKQDIVVTLTDIMKNVYATKNLRNLITIYNGRNYAAPSEVTNATDVSTIHQLKEKYKIIGSHCLLTKRKGIHQIIKSLVDLNDYALVLIGSGQELDHLKAEAGDLGVLDRCFFVGYRPDAIAYLAYFDIYVMSSYSEGFPLGLLEAGLSKLPIVCSDISIFRELFSENEVCFFELDNINSLVDAINLCFNNRGNLSRSIFNLITEKYSVKNMVNSYLKLYSKEV